MRCADVHEILSLFSNRNVFSFINICIFAELYSYFNKGSECLNNSAIYFATKESHFFSWIIKFCHTCNTFFHKPEYYVISVFILPEFKFVLEHMICFCPFQMYFVLREKIVVNNEINIFQSGITFFMNKNDLAISI